MVKIDCVVVGAGVIGLAIARRFAECGHEVLVLEEASRIGTGISSRNSEVVHAGIYYRPGTLMAELCVTGSRALYAFCADHNVDIVRCGKLIVATEIDQVPHLSSIATNAAANGVRDLQRISKEEAKELEPELRCAGALLSPSTGIVDSHAFMVALQGAAEAAGAVIAFCTKFERASAAEQGISFRIEGSNDEFWCRTFINCAALNAVAIANRIDGLAPHHVPRLHLAKGSYFALVGSAPFRRLIYPTPMSGGLGIHLTLDLRGRARFGPDVEWIDTVDFTIDPSRGTSFYDAIRRYWPGLADGSLIPDYCGIRPKIVPAGAPAQDFVVQGPADHGVPGLINLFGIESPGLTASLALADYVLKIYRRQQ